MEGTDSRVNLPGESYTARESALLATYAMHGENSAGRRHKEPIHAYRGPYARDRDRIVHSSAYRRLSYKTQVFTGELGDFHRNRLTHTLEVSSVARTLGRALGLNEDLIEALALLHDLGHPPFGHAGEDVLDACLAREGGFSHNAQALRIVELLEVRYPQFPGLNLSIEVLAGQSARANKRIAGARPLLESQVVDAADSIAYDTHDADDALELGLLSLNDLLQTSLWAEAAGRVKTRHGKLEAKLLRKAVLHELIDWQIDDLLRVAAERLAEQRVDSVAAVRLAPTIVGPSADLAKRKAELESLLMLRVYRHETVMQHRRAAQAKLHEMFDYFVVRPECMPEKFAHLAATQGPCRAVGDYLAGMTDRYAMRTYERELK